MAETTTAVLMFACTICDKPGNTMTLHDFPMHSECVPKYWLSDHKDQAAFMTRVSLLAPSRLERWRRWK